MQKIVDSMASYVVYYIYNVVCILHFRGNSMPSPPSKSVTSGLTPCRLPVDQWTKCTENNCYLNYRCPVYQGIYPNPVRDYIPLPPVFIRVSPYEAVPFSYHIVIQDIDGED